MYEPQLRWAIHKEKTYPIYIMNLAIGVDSNDTIMFTDFKTTEQIYYHANGGNAGEGISRMAGNRSYPIFGFAEAKMNPRIFIVSYPDFKIYNIIETVSVALYIALRFVETEYMVAISGYPDFQLKVFNYRLGNLLAVVDTSLPTDTQKLECNINPFLCSQYAPGLNRLILWEVYVNLDSANIIRRNINLKFLNNNLMESTFGPDGNLYILDKLSRFYMVHSSTGVHSLLMPGIDQNEAVAQYIAITNFRSGFVLVCSNSMMKYVQKSNNIWTTTWEFLLNVPVYFARVPVDSEIMYCMKGDGCLMVLDEKSEPHKLTQMGYSKNILTFFRIIRPFNEHVAVITRLQTLRILEIKTKEIISSIPLFDLAMFEAHPKIPILCAVDKLGRIYIISAFDPKSVKFLVDFQLSDQKLFNLKMTKNFIVAQDIENKFFIIYWKMGSSDLIVQTIEPCNFLAYKFLLIEENVDLNIFICVLNLNVNYIEKIMILTLTDHSTFSNPTTYQLPAKYASITIMNNETLVGAVWKENWIHFIKWDGIQFSISDSFKSPHQLNFYKLSYEQGYLISRGLDGFICIYNSEEKKVLSMVKVLNRRVDDDFPNKVELSSSHCIVLCRSGHSKCFQWQQKTVIEKHNLDEFSNMKLNNPSEGIPWTEMKKRELLEAEKMKYKKIKEDILDDLEALKLKFKYYLDENEIASEDDKLPIENFNLAKEWIDIIVEKARANRESEEKSLRKYIEDQNRIRNWIVEKTWNLMGINSSKLLGIFSEIMCENYAMADTNLKKYQSEYDLISSIRETENVAALVDLWLPWVPASAMPRLIKEIQRNYAQTSVLTIHESEESIRETNDNSKMYALSGTASYKFIKPNIYRYHQLEVTNYNQLFIENFLAKYDVYNLKLYFNKEFQEMMAFKKDQINFIRQRNDRLRLVISEMNALERLKKSDKIYESVINDPTFMPVENPESIIKVEETEVSVSPYISPSQQKILDDLAYQAEQRRLALLADDFHERALVAMMDGVLEKRWEDEIKKDPPKPECIVKNKNPKDYTKDDKKAIAEYEEKVKFTLLEREKYKVMLDEEEERIHFIQHDQIVKLNKKCGQIFIKKMQVDAAIKHEEMKLLRLSAINIGTVKLKEAETLFKKVFSELKKDITQYSKTSVNIEKTLQECRAKYDRLLNYDKLLDKQFKIQVGEIAVNFIVEQAYKIFRRRPKWQQKAWATGSFLLKMASRIINKDSSRTGIPLPEECYDFLTTLDNYDNFALAPNTIDQKLWLLICNLRRTKIKNEFKLRACVHQIAQAETTHNIFLKEIASKKAKLATNEKEFNNLCLKNNEALMNRSLQIVMPMAQVEVPISGSIEDFQGCLLLHIDDVADINDIIKKAGMKKLRAMQKVAVFRRKVIYKEWEHKVLQMSVEDLKEYLAVIEHSKVSLEMRRWLREKSEGRVVELTNAILARTVEGKIQHMHKELTEIDDKIDMMTRKINEQKDESMKLDKSIQDINVDITEQTILKDELLEAKEARQHNERLHMAMKRGRLIRSIQTGHARLLELTTLLELQRLRTFPTLTSLEDPCQLRF